MVLARMAALALFASFFAAFACAQQPQLEAVLTQMDEASTHFKSASADFSWDQYQSVVDEHDIQTGKIYFRRNSHETQMALDIEKPATKKVVFSNGKLSLFQPKINQITEKDTGANREAVESFLVLGFGGRGHDLLKTYDVTYSGTEKIGSTDTVKLELIPKAPSVRKMFNKIIVWVDPKQDISLKQQAFEPSGDYRIATYTAIKLNPHISDDTFKIKSDSATKIVRQ
ncbi:MAG: outer-membrane lipoprotein carrier protein LolA [Acidobacteriaceae bacterium]